MRQTAPEFVVDAKRAFGWRPIFRSQSDVEAARIFRQQWVAMPGSALRLRVRLKREWRTVIVRDRVASSTSRYFDPRIVVIAVLGVTILGLMILAVRHNTRGTATVTAPSKAVALAPAIPSTVPPKTTEAPPSGDRVWALRLLAQQGNASAQNDIGTLYETGQGVTQDFGAALKWYAAAAASGEAHAETNLGRLYAAGHGVGQNFAEAAKWYQKAAEQADSDAQTRLGVLYTRGDGVPNDYAAALKWFQLAAGRGDAHAELDLAVMYGTGLGLAPDRGKAVQLAQQSAAQGNANAASYLAYLTSSRDRAKNADQEPHDKSVAGYATGWDTTTKDDDAIDWLQRAAGTAEKGAEP